jgi:hypothetical protein
MPNKVTAAAPEQSWKQQGPLRRTLMYSTGIAGIAASMVVGAAANDNEPRPQSPAPIVEDVQESPVRAASDPETTTAPTSAPRGADPDQKGRLGYYGGVVVIGEQTFHYGSGIPGRFSIPYGSYELHIPPIQMRSGRDWGDIGPIGQRIGSVATVNDPGRDTGTIKDPLTGHLAKGIQIHSASSSQLDHLYSHGCFAISRQEWPAFKAALLRMAREQGPLVLNIGHDGSARISPVAQDAVPAGGIERSAVRQ